MPTEMDGSCSQEPTNERFYFILLFTPGAIKEKREDKQLASEKSGVSKLSQPSCRMNPSKAVRIGAEQGALGQPQGNSSHFGR